MMFGFWSIKSQGFTPDGVRPKNSAETRWRIEPQGLLKDSPLCDDATPVWPNNSSVTFFMRLFWICFELFASLISRYALEKAAGLGVRPKNSVEVRWRIEAQGLLKDSPLCDEATPIAAYRGRRLDEPTPAGCHRIPPGRKSHP